MERHFERNQRSVSGRALRALVYVLPLVCIGIAIVAALIGQGATQVDDDVFTRDEAEAGGQDGMLDRARALLGMKVRESSTETFLRDLTLNSHAQDPDAVASDGEGATEVLYWVEEGDLPVVAENVLRAYADTGEARLAASGYLDMQGNVWGAIVQGGDAWCDVVLVNTEGGRESTVRVTRLLPGEV